MNLTALQAELAARGFDYVSTARQTQWLNDAMHEICEAYDWPFLETTTSGVAPLTISDLRAVLAVLDTTNDRPLAPIDVRTLAELDPTLSTTFTPTTTGTATNYYLDGTTTLRVWPADTTSVFAVKYVKNATDLSAGADIPVIPTRFHSSIVDVAQALASIRDESNDKDNQTLRAEVERVVQRMANVLLSRDLSGPQYVIPVVSENC